MPRTKSDQLPKYPSERAPMLKKAKYIESLRRAHATAAIGSGILDTSSVSYWEEVLYRLAEPRTEKAKNAMLDIFERLEQLAPDATKIPMPRSDVPDNFEWAEDVIQQMLTDWADAGFYLGVAIGMQLGPHAFDQGGGR